jgi:hypothetical protein
MASIHLDAPRLRRLPELSEGYRILILLISSQPWEQQLIYSMGHAHQTDRSNIMPSIKLPKRRPGDGS